MFEFVELVVVCDGLVDAGAEVGLDVVVLVIGVEGVILKLGELPGVGVKVTPEVALEDNGINRGFPF